MTAVFRRIHCPANKLAALSIDTDLLAALAAAKHISGFHGAASINLIHPAITTVTADDTDISLSLFHF